MADKIKTAHPRGADSARVIQVVESKSIVGTGTGDDVYRMLTQYWSLDGQLLAESDPCYIISELVDGQ